MRDLVNLRGMALLAEGPGHRDTLVELMRDAASCLEHGVSELWTADRDFSYFPSLHPRKPLVG